jgi:hypothetical protein
VVLAQSRSRWGSRRPSGEPFPFIGSGFIGGDSDIGLGSIVFEIVIEEQPQDILTEVRRDHCRTNAPRVLESSISLP